MILHGAAGAHADQVLHAILSDQLVGIDADGGNAHAGAHGGDSLALVGAGEAPHTAHVVEFDGVLEEGVGNVLRSSGIAGEQDAFSNIAGFGANM